MAGPLPRDSSILVQRGDLDGFAVILGLMREAEARDHLEDHIRHAAKGARQKSDVEHVVARQLACDPFADSGRALRNSPAPVAAPSEDTSLLNGSLATRQNTDWPQWTEKRSKEH